MKYTRHLHRIYVNANGLCCVLEFFNSILPFSLIYNVNEISRSVIILELLCLSYCRLWNKIPISLCEIHCEEIDTGTRCLLGSFIFSCSSLFQSCSISFCHEHTVGDMLSCHRYLSWEIFPRSGNLSLCHGSVSM
jgi:hypothetical protein